MPAWDHSIAAFLAKRKIDVWAMDYGWALVPENQQDFQFMKDWGIEKDARHAEIALSLARAIRGLTGQGLGKMHLLGFSWGATVAYTLAGDETQLPRFLRNVKGLIPVDLALKLDRSDETGRLQAATRGMAERLGGVIGEVVSGADALSAAAGQVTAEPLNIRVVVARLPGV